MPPPESIDDLLRERRDVDRREGQSAAREPRQAEQIVDQSAHALALAPHDLQIPLRLGREAIAVVLGEGEREPIDAAEGRPQIVRHAVAECLELAVCGRELPGPLGDPPFQFMLGS